MGGNELERDYCFAFILLHEEEKYIGTLSVTILNGPLEEYSLLRPLLSLLPLLNLSLWLSGRDLRKQQIKKEVPEKKMQDLLNPSEGVWNGLGRSSWRTSTIQSSSYLQTPEPSSLPPFILPLNRFPPVVFAIRACPHALLWSPCTWHAISRSRPLPSLMARLFFGGRPRPMRCYFSCLIVAPTVMRPLCSHGDTVPSLADTRDSVGCLAHVCSLPRSPMMEAQKTEPGSLCCKPST